MLSRQNTTVALALLLLTACGSHATTRSTNAGGSGGDEGGSAGSDSGGSTGGRSGTGGSAMGGSGGTGGDVGGGTGGVDAGPDDESEPDGGPAVHPTDAAPAVDGGPPPKGACAKWLGNGPRSSWVGVGADDQLVYKTIDAKGDRIMDFSHAGYMGGGVALPTVPVATMVDPPAGDATMAIQAAIDSVAAKPLMNGVRGAVLLKPGTFQLSGTLNITASGVVLRGSGSGTGGTLIQMTGMPHNFLVMHGSGKWTDSGAPAMIADAYVPSGATSFTVDNASAFKVGDTILVRRPVTASWIHFMGMDTLVRNGAPQTWLSTSTLIPADRTITAINGNKITVDVPLSDSYDAQYVKPPGVTVTKYTFAGRIEQVGVEHLRVTAPVTNTSISATLFTLFRGISAVKDGWISDVSSAETENSISFGQDVKRFTLQDWTLTRSMIADGSSGYPLEVSIDGTQILVQRANIKGDNLYTFATLSRVTGPNVVLNSVATGTHTRLEPHERWATGLLADGVVHDDQLNLVNRGTAGSGHGWAIGFGVLWNSAAATLNVQKPPGAMNWSIGGKGKTNGDGTFEATGTPVFPQSLYLAQLCARLGPAAVAAIGYK